MQHPSRLSPDPRGTRWLQAQVEEFLMASAVALAPTRFEGDTACYWGTDRETQTTLYVRLASDPEPKALQFNFQMIARCGSGLYSGQASARLFIRRELVKMGILHT